MEMFFCDLLKVCKIVFNLFIVFLLLFLCPSCDKRSNKEESNLVTIEKVDSIRVDWETKITILDFDQNKSRYLAVDQVTKEFLIIDNTGKVLESIQRFGDGPNEYNSSLIAASFFEEKGGYLLLSSRDLIWYSDVWEVNDRFRFVSEWYAVFYTGPRYAVPYYYQKNGSDIFVFTNFFSGFNSNAGIKDTNIDFLVEQFNPVADRLEKVILFKSADIPRIDLPKGNSSMPVQVYHLDKEKNLMYLTFQHSNEIGVYDLRENFELKYNVNFNHDVFNQSNNSKNVGLFRFDQGLTGILYFKGLNESSEVAKKSVDPNYVPFFDPKLYGLILIKDDKSIEVEVPFPFPDCEPNSEIVQLPGNRILMRDIYNGDVEPEFSSYSIFEVSVQ
ncbi:hypothetical protein [Echinicola rosea]|nr:hypothetical protein [Echinicola rosea]